MRVSLSTINSPLLRKDSRGESGNHWLNIERAGSQKEGSEREPSRPI